MFDRRRDLLESHMPPLQIKHRRKGLKGMKKGRKNAKRYDRMHKDFKKIGFCPSETWSLDNAMIENLYERVLLYRKDASNVINMNHHSVDYKNTTMTQAQAVDLLIKLCQEHISYDYIDSDGNALFKNEREWWLKFDDDMETFHNGRTEEEIAQEIWDLWAVLHPYMWW